MPTSPGRPSKGNVRLTLHVPPELKSALETEAFKTKLTMSQIVIEALLDRGFVIQKPPTQLKEST